MIELNHNMKSWGNQLIQDYLKRRSETVMQALVELRPDLIRYLHMEQTFAIHDLESKVNVFSQAYEKGEIRFAGIWRDHWQYRLHGIGCELTNMTNGEHFDWDLDKPEMFFSGEFYEHLHWRCKNDSENAEIKLYLDWLQQHGSNNDLLLYELAQNRIIEQKQTHQWVYIHDN